MSLLLEVGCEEIPARFLREAEKALGERVLAGLREVRLLPAEHAGAVGDAPLQTYSTPRRLVAHIPALLAEQPAKVEEVLGPPVKVAIDATGKYTRAAVSFAEKNRARLEELTRTTTTKGEYLSLQKTTPGRPAREILAELLPAAVLSLSFPKSMYWTAKSAPRFVRPIRWVLAALGEGRQGAETLRFEILGVESNQVTYGHRAKGGRPHHVRDFDDYIKKLVQLSVNIDYASRQKMIHESAAALLESLSLKLVADEDLADWIANSTEWPLPILGSFDERFLHLPREILITVMRDHQKYFAVEDAKGNLQAHFVAVLNVEADSKGLIRRGHERVLTARFRDAEFFWNADQRTPLAARTAWLEKVTYQAELGSYGDKVRRMKALAQHLCESLEAQGRLQAGQREQVLRAIELCKCDLTTQMVQEFTELQGIVGGLYAKAQGELEDVATAIYDHYLPAGAEGKSPRSIVGAVVSVADKMDSVVAGFAAGHEPTGSSDPFALRRQANGIIKVMVEFSLPVGIWPLVEEGLTILGKGSGETVGGVMNFFRERLKFYLETIGKCRNDTAKAVIASQWKSPADALKRALAIKKVRDTDDYTALAAAAKRTRNILKKSASPEEYQSGRVEEGLFQEDAERELYGAYGSIFGQVTAGGMLEQDYEMTLTLTARLRPQIDRFFDKVLVMHPDLNIRRNRLVLLQLLDTQVFSAVCDLSEIETNVGASTSRAEGPRE